VGTAVDAVADGDAGAGRETRRGRLPPSLEEALLGSWPLPFGWIVIAEPVAGGQLRDMVSQAEILGGSGPPGAPAGLGGNHQGLLRDVMAMQPGSGTAPYGGPASPLAGRSAVVRSGTCGAGADDGQAEPVPFTVPGPLGAGLPGGVIHEYRVVA